MKIAKTYFVMLTGVAIIAAATGFFFLPNKIVSGGVSGISTILFYLFRLEPGITFAIINSALLFAGFKILGKTFVIRTVVASIGMSVFVQLFSKMPPLTDDLFLSSFFGSVMYGIGTGLALVSDSSTGGTDIVGRLLQHKNQHIPIGKLLLVCDGVIILISLFVFGKIDLALYGTVSVVVSTFVVDMLIHRLNVCALVLVVSDKGQEISQTIVNKLNRGVTVANVVGAYRNQNTKLLICAMKEKQIPMFEKTVHEIDKSAFIIFTESTHIVGSGFNVYK